MPRSWHALKRGESAQERRRVIERAYETFISTADPPASEHPPGEVRPLVYESWLRSQERTIDPEHAPTLPALSADELTELRASHPMSRVLRVIHRLLLSEATAAGFIVAVGDAAGRLLWVDGQHNLRTRAEDMGFTAGMDWSESAVGTSAPGSALVLGHSLQVLAEEHYNRNVHSWSCTASPVHDPISGSILGFIDVTGNDEAASPQILPLVEATVATVEAELAIDALKASMAKDRGRASRSVPSRARTGSARLLLLGREPAVLEYSGESHTVTQRHAEILVALAASPAGLTAATLAEHVYGQSQAERTLRAEVVRLRKYLRGLGLSLTIESRPYRLNGSLRIDANEALHALGSGAHRLALSAYEGPVLPGSEAPAVRELRTEVDSTLREAMLQSASPDQLYTYGQHWALDDRQIWETLLQVLPPLSPKRARVLARLDLL